MRYFFIPLLILFCSIFTAQTSIAQSYISKIGEVDSLYSDILGEQREIYVELPERFNPKSDPGYPVVFVLDGESLTDAVSTVHKFYWGGFMPEMIIVGIANLANRNRDLTISKVDSLFGMPNRKESGEAINFLTFIEKELIPHIASKYPISDYRTLIGHSYGGLFTLNALVHRPELFDNYVAIDPSLQWDNQILLKQAEEAFKKNQYAGKSVFISLAGQLHAQNPDITIDNVMEDQSPATLFARSNIAFTELARQSGHQDFRVEWQFYENDLHGTIPLPSIMDGLKTLFDWYQMENTSIMNDPGTSVDAIGQWIRKRATKLESNFGYTFPPMDEEFLNGLGYMYKDMGQPDKSKLYFEMAIEYYPKSANAYDSMADYFASQEDFENALKNVKKAFEISGSGRHERRVKRFEKKVGAKN